MKIVVGEEKKEGRGEGEEGDSYTVGMRCDAHACTPDYSRSAGAGWPKLRWTTGDIDQYLGRLALR